MDHDWREMAHDDWISHLAMLEMYFTSELGELVTSFAHKNCRVIFLLDMDFMYVIYSNSYYVSKMKQKMFVKNNTSTKVKQ